MNLSPLKFLSRHLTAACHNISQNVTISSALSRPVRRWYSSVPEPYHDITVKLDPQTGVCILEMKKKPVNSLSLEFLTELNIALEKITNDKSIRGVIITSALPVFSAGLDLMELYQSKEERLDTFWHNVQELGLNVYSSPKVVISAIEGSCIAGGCIFAWGSDYRVMSEGKHMIGLNETRLGIAAPFWFADMAVNTMGFRNAEKMLQLGETYPAKEALRLGAVDEVCPQGKSLELAQERMREWLSIPDSGRQVTKQMVRQQFIDKFRKKRQEDKETFSSMVTAAGTQRLLGQYVEAMKKKAK